MKIPSMVRSAALGVVAVALIAALGFWLNRGSQTRLDGTILKVRTIATDDNASIAVVDFRVTNPARALFLVKEVTLAATLADGRVVEGLPVAEMDLDRVLEYNKMIGPRFNPVLRARERITSGTGLDRTAAGSFDVSEALLAKRKALVVRIQDSDGAVTEIAEGPSK